ncbi:DUF502 domain-containing protein [Dehalococcoides mccartyi]|jgi:uncharacterized membrane protein|uniref:DUF502 domain-containing protein n=1 Tax=Dehalococcoides mccartyi TaxID=61435 RepID=UPI0003C836CD|nr:DUF502 domain-containing protein [Dehalococcoides mccartyi]AHB13651.1 hypothetical protein GY50_0871 [Dehalococcoides mccartyi GY50]AII58034.1 hypothetical protein X792_04515 [Dehalococcoides mccartyi CG1]APH12544.1 hypothetical protein ASJ33_04950 [Dehalococcoides mccartyi]
MSPPNNKALKIIRNRFFTGLAFVLPIGAALGLLIWVFNIVDGMLKPVIEFFFDWYFPGLGLLVTLLLIYLVGLVLSNYFGKQILGWIDKLLTKVPIFNQVYNSAKQVIETLGVSNKVSFKEAVMVEFPRAGMHSLAFIANETTNSSGEKLYLVYVPGSPNPTSGFLELLRENQIERVNISVEDAMKTLLSCGLVFPETVQSIEIGKGDLRPGKI